MTSPTAPIVIFFREALIAALIVPLMFARHVGAQVTEDSTVVPPAVTNAGDRWVMMRNDREFMAFRWCPPGTFTMGSPANEGEKALAKDEKQVKVTISRGFWMAETEVSQAQWSEVMGGTNPSKFKGMQLPVESVRWDEAKTFCDRLSQSSKKWTVALPTEAQWEYACRAGTTTPFSFGATITTDQVNFNGNFPYAGGAKGEYREKSTPVGSLPANQWGLREMHGNVWEWCADWYANPLEGGTNPMGPKTGTHRVLRGGSWFNVAMGCRSADRNYLAPTIRYPVFGFRVLLSVP
jgi:sulfatase modifying factor 1